MRAGTELTVSTPATVRMAPIATASPASASAEKTGSEQRAPYLKVDYSRAYLALCRVISKSD